MSKLVYVKFLANFQDFQDKIKTYLQSNAFAKIGKYVIQIVENRGALFHLFKTQSFVDSSISILMPLN